MQLESLVDQKAALHTEEPAQSVVPPSGSDKVEEEVTADPPAGAEPLSAPAPGGHGSPKDGHGTGDAVQDGSDDMEQQRETDKPKTVHATAASAPHQTEEHLPLPLHDD